MPTTLPLRAVPAAFAGLLLLLVPTMVAGQSLRPKSVADGLQQPYSHNEQSDLASAADITPVADLLAPPSAAPPSAVSPNPSAVAQAPVRNGAMAGAGGGTQQISLASTPNMIGDAILNSGPVLIIANGRGGNSGTLAIAGGDRRSKISEDSSPLPTDRLFFDFNHFNHAAVTADGHVIDVDRYTFGFEKTFLDGDGSIEVRAPLVGGLSAQEFDAGPTSANQGTVFGNLSITPKYLLAKSDVWAASLGMSINLPTAPDISEVSTFNFAPYASTFHIRNQSVHLEPFVGVLFTPNQRLFSISYIEFDFDENGSPATNQLAGGPVVSAGRFRDATLMHVDISTGYWLYDRREVSQDSWALNGYVSGIAPVVELHYTTALENFSQAVFSTPFEREDALNLTAGFDFQLGRLSSLRVAAVAPLRTSPRDKEFDSEILVQLDRHF